MSVLDTNIIVRHLTQDSTTLSPRARIVFDQLHLGTRSVRIPEGVLVEAVQVLESKRMYNTPRATIHRDLAGLIHMRGVRMINKRLYLRSLALYEAHPQLSFVDCLCVAYAEREADRTVITFDRGFDRAPTIS